MAKQIKIGDRVNVNMIITESWQSEAGMYNGEVKGIENYGLITFYYISKDINSGKLGFKRQLNSGHFSDSGYSITKL